LASPLFPGRLQRTKIKCSQNTNYTSASEPRRNYNRDKA
jgi:hypothetical protein